VNPHPTDIEDSMNFAEVVTHVPKSIEILLGLLSLEVIRKSWQWRKWRRKNLQDMEEEVRKGRSAIVPNRNAEFHRVAHVSCIELITAEGVLVDIGRWDPKRGALVPRFSLPGTKVNGWEAPDQALQRWLSEDLCAISQVIERTTVTNKQTWSWSEKHQMMTMYDQNVFSATVRFGEEWPSIFKTAGRIEQKSLFILTEKDLLHLYTFMSESEFEQLTGSSRDHEIHNWMACLHIDENLCPKPLFRASMASMGTTS